MASSLGLLLEQYNARANARAGNDLETLIADVTLEPDGVTVDPAAWDSSLFARLAPRASRAPFRYRGGGPVAQR